MTVADDPAPVDAPVAKARRRGALLVVAGLAGAGVLVGALWGWVAPPAHAVIALTDSDERVHAYVGSEADHFFVAAFMMLGMLSVLAVVAAVLVWQWRIHRGPLMAAAVSVGAVAASATAAAVGSWLVQMRYPTVSIEAAPVTPDDRVYYLAEAPSVFFGHTPLQMAAGMLVPAAAGALAYAMLTVAADRDDLGAWPPRRPVAIPWGTVTAADAPPPGR